MGILWFFNFQKRVTIFVKTFFLRGKLVKGAKVRFYFTLLVFEYFINQFGK